MTDLNARLKAHTYPFLACLTGCAVEDAWDTEAHWQTFTDPSPKPSPDPLADHWHQTIDEAAQKLEALNDRNAGIFVTVNPTDGKGRGKPNIPALRGWWADLDDKAASAPFTLDRLPLPPTMAVKTPGGWHLYWLAPEAMPSESEARRDEHETELLGIQKVLEAFGADRKTCNVNCVLRLPGLFHRKDKPRLVELALVDGPRYSRDQIRAAFPPVLRSATRAQEPASPKAPKPNREEVLKRAGAYLSTMPGGVQGEDGSGATFEAALKVITKFNLAEAEALDLVERIHNPKCEPEWSLKELQHKVADAWKQAQLSPHLGEFEKAETEAKPYVHPTLPLPKVDDIEWPEPQALTPRVEPKPYPLDALPKTVWAAVEEVRAYVKAPAPLVASSALASLSLAIQAHADVRRDEVLVSPTSLFLLTIAPSGERKSQADKGFSKPIQDYQDAQEEINKPLVRKWKAAEKAWDASVKGIQDAIRAAAKDGKDTANLMLRLSKLEDEKPEKPRVPKLIREDTTPEGLAKKLENEWPSSGIMSNEAGIVFGSHGMTSDSLTRNLSLLNKLWDGGRYQSNRGDEERSRDVKGARLTMGLMIQEKTLKAFFDNSKGLARGTGFLARFLIAWPDSNMGTRFYTPPVAGSPALSAFNRRVSAILDRTVEVDKNGALTPSVLALSAEAMVEWIAFHDRIERELAPGGDCAEVADVASKTADNAVRLAALFHVFENVEGGFIGVGNLRDASRIVEWHLYEARRFLGEIDLPPTIGDAAALDTWLIEKCPTLGTGEGCIKNSVVMNRAPGRLRKREVLTQAVQMLQELGRVRQCNEGHSRFIQVNPALLTPNSQKSVLDSATAFSAIVAIVDDETLPIRGEQSQQSQQKQSQGFKSPPPAVGDDWEEI